MALTTRPTTQPPPSRPPGGWVVTERGAPGSLWWTTIGVVIVGMLMPLLTTGVLVETLYNPPTRDLPTPRPGIDSQITRIYDGAGNQIGTLHRFDTHIPITQADVPQVLKDAVVSIEDKRFYSHKGIDLQSVVRALWADLQGGNYQQGGSTITQQYVKRIYTGPQKSLSRKIREAVLAGRVDHQLSKDVIIYRYLSDVYLGSGAYGVGAAAETYFRKPVNQLTVSEAATLAGLIQSPSNDEPRSNTGAAEARRETVLKAMVDQGRITSADYDTALSQRLVLAVDDPKPSFAATLVYPPAEVQSQYPYFVDYVRRYLIAKYGEDAVYQGGLKVETTIDSRLQGLAEAAVNGTLSGTSPPLDMALVSVEPSTGHVKALVGGRDFTQSQVNLALGNCTGAPKPDPGGPICIDGGGSGRQPGSSFKAFTLAKAFEEGITPNKVYNAPASYTIPHCVSSGPNSGCTIHNAEPAGFGALSVREAAAESVNTVFAQLILDVGVKDTAEMAHRLGITMVRPDGKTPSGQPFGPSLTLGAAEVSPLDMAGAYSVFANRGQQVPPTPVTKVTDPKGKVLEDNTARKGRRVIPEAVADTVNDVLKGVIAHGTGYPNADLGRPLGSAGKTGTGEDYHDAWFVGYTQQLSTAVWMGYSSGQKPLVNIKGVDKVYGGTLPAMTWKAFMAPALGSAPDIPFVAPGALPNAPAPPTTVPSFGTQPPGTVVAGPTDTALPGDESSTIPPPLSVPPYTTPASTVPPTTPRTTVPFTQPHTTTTLFP
ncbi:MAG: transglycosylase domain-containing protein [Acidimicrobiales bacterium]